MMSRWTTRDPLREAGGLNLYAFVGNNPVNWVDPWGLDMVRNYTGLPLMISGNPGADHGIGGQYYAIIPPDGRIYGGAAHPVDAYPTPLYALIVANQSLLDALGLTFPIGQSQPVCDIDFYNDPTKPQVPAKPDSALNRKLPGDELGPITKFTRDDNGKIKIDKKDVIPSWIRWAGRKL
jgi:hypothetical protein